MGKGKAGRSQFDLPFDLTKPNLRQMFVQCLELLLEEEMGPEDSIHIAMRSCP